MSELGSVTVQGVDGKLYWGYHLVGTVRSWTATRSASGVLALTATLNQFDTTVSQRPIVFVVQHQHGAWRWPLESLQIAGETLSASIRPA